MEEKRTRTNGTNNNYIDRAKNLIKRFSANTGLEVKEGNQEFVDWLLQITTNKNGLQNYPMNERVDSSPGRPTPLRTASHILSYVWHLLICSVHRNSDVRACTQHLILGIALGSSLGPLSGPCLPSEARHARSEATRFVTANCT